jgi:predicted helicase
MRRGRAAWPCGEGQPSKAEVGGIREKFNAYRFADHKEKVIDLLMRVTRVSVETMEIVEAMKKEKR